MKRKHGRDVNNLSLFCPLQHQLACKLGKTKDGGKIGSDRFPPILGWTFSGRSAPNHSGVVDENVDRAKCGDGFFDQGRADPSVSNVTGKINFLSSQRAEIFAGFAGIWITPVASGIRARLRQGDRHRRPKLCVRTRNEGIFAVELEDFENHLTKTYIRNLPQFQI